MTFAWIEERRAEWPVAQLCSALGVSRSGYYAWRSRVPSAADTRRETSTEEVAEVHAQMSGRYGSPRVHVARVMRGAGVAAKTERKFRQTTDSSHPRPVAENVLDRDSDPGEPNASWEADIPTREGWLDSAVVADLFSRLVVGWSMAAKMTSRLVVNALGMALGRRPGGLRVWCRTRIGAASARASTISGHSARRGSPAA